MNYYEMLIMINILKLNKGLTGELVLTCNRCFLPTELHFMWGYMTHSISVLLEVNAQNV